MTYYQIKTTKPWTGVEQKFSLYGRQCFGQRFLKQRSLPLISLLFCVTSWSWQKIHKLTVILVVPFLIKYSNLEYNAPKIKLTSCQPNNCFRCCHFNSMVCPREDPWLWCPLLFCLLFQQFCELTDLFLSLSFILSSRNEHPCHTATYHERQGWYYYYWTYTWHCQVLMANKWNGSHQ